MDLFIIATVEKTRNDKLYQEDILLGTYLKVKKRSGGRFTKAEALEKASEEQGKLSHEVVQEYVDTDERKAKLISFKVMPKPTPRYTKGEYYAHEYDQYLEGRGRLIKWSDTLVTGEVECLDKTKSVYDKTDWEVSNSRHLSNGCGDEFYPDSPLK